MALVAVEVEGRSDALHLFERPEDAQAFQQAARASGSSSTRTEKAPHSPMSAARLIAKERGDAVEKIGWSALAEDIREGLDAATALERVRKLRASDAHEVEIMLQEWVPNARQAEPAYTIVGRYEDNGQPYTTTVYTHDGPEAALDLAHRTCAEDNRVEDAELEILALFAGEPRLVDFDAEETWPRP